MVYSGPQKYPGASTAYWHQSAWGGSRMEANVCCLHTTEGRTVPGYSGGGSAPNLTALPDFGAQRLRWYQHFDIDRSSRALRNLSGGVETNSLNVVQVELVGTCDYSHRASWDGRIAGRDYVYWADPPAWAVRDLAAFLRWLNTNHGVPLSGPSMWLTYGPDSRRPGITPASYGASPARMTFAQWNGFKGVCGHQHVPENDHGDPGSLPMAAILAAAKGGTTEEEDPMAGTIDKAEFSKALLDALSRKEVREALCRAAWLTDGVTGVPADWTSPGNEEWQPWSGVVTNGKKIRGVEALVKAQAATIDKLVDTIAAGPGADLEALKAEIREAIEGVTATVRLDVQEG